MQVAYLLEKHLQMTSSQQAATVALPPLEAAELLLEVVGPQSLLSQQKPSPGRQSQEHLHSLIQWEQFRLEEEPPQLDWTGHSSE